MTQWKHYGTIAVLGICCLAGACNRNGAGPLGGNSSATGDSADQDTKNQKNQPKKGGQDTQLDEPQNAVDGKPSAASDRGSASAVAHHSVAQPGAPQGTVPKESASPVPAGSTPPRLR